MTVVLLSTVLLEQGTASDDVEVFFQALRWVLAPCTDFYLSCMDAIGGPVAF